MDFLNSALLLLMQAAVALAILVQAVFVGFTARVAYSPHALPVSTVANPKTTTAIELATSTSPSKRVATSTKKTPLASVPTAKPALPPAIPPVPVVTIDAETLNTQTRAAVVNILCTTQTSSAVRPISASGIIIDTHGVVLTNAHVGQFFLLRDYPTKDNVDCVIRTGSPAQPHYRATLLYLPPAWVDANASQLTAEQAVGTGEGDYALLLINSSVNSSIPLPASFPIVPMTYAEPDTGLGVLLAAYPAGFLDGSTILKNLYPTSAYATVADLFTFDDAARVDLVSVPGTVVSQGGSSGGAVVRGSDGKLIALIATDTNAITTAERDLRAVTMSYIDRNLRSVGKGGVGVFLSQDLQAAATSFATSIAPSEKKKLLEALQAH